MQFNHRQRAALVESDKMLWIDPSKGKSWEYMMECEEYTQKMLLVQQDRNFLEANKAPIRPNRTPEMIQKKAWELKEMIEFLKEKWEYSPWMTHEQMLRGVEWIWAVEIMHRVKWEKKEIIEDIEAQTLEEVQASYITLYWKEKYDSLSARWKSNIEWLSKKNLEK